MLIAQDASARVGRLKSEWSARAWVGGDVHCEATSVKRTGQSMAMDLTHPLRKLTPKPIARKHSPDVTPLEFSIYSCIKKTAAQTGKMLANTSSPCLLDCLLKHLVTLGLGNPRRTDAKCLGHTTFLKPFLMPVGKLSQKGHPIIQKTEWQNSFASQIISRIHANIRI